jgi:myo-inositol-1-phosphate synthase
LRKDIREFKAKNGLERVVIVWTANTERFVDVRKGLNTTADEILASIKRNDPEVSGSQVFAVAAILEGCPYVNGAPQNTLTPGMYPIIISYLFNLRSSAGN